MLANRSSDCVNQRDQSGSARRYICLMSIRFRRERPLIIPVQREEICSRNCCSKGKGPLYFRVDIRASAAEAGQYIWINCATSRSSIMRIRAFSSIRRRSMGSAGRSHHVRLMARIFDSVDVDMAGNHGIILYQQIIIRESSNYLVKWMPSTRPADNFN